ncbi:MAG: alpha/beta fold hydrolase, partial [Opitutae bacterium]|nr:alpha/beta fold hydrolase [Opitutae bacterium]
MPSPKNPAAGQPLDFGLSLPDLALERGGVVRRHRLHGWWWGPAGDTPQRPARHLPTVLLVHALTGCARAGGRDGEAHEGWWAPLIGPGRALDPARCRVLCFNHLGSFYGSSAPGTPGFPAGKNITLTTGDLARSILAALDELGLPRLRLAAGGSLGGLVVLALAALAPRRVERILPVAATAASSAWVVGWNHVAREILRLDPGYPHNVVRGLELARQLAMLTYRAEPGLDAAQHRRLPPLPGHRGYLVQSYLDHHGAKLHQRFTPRSYELLLDAMDHHDLLVPLPGRRSPAIRAIRAAALVVDIDTDQLF